ncbi:hypothetical protein [Luteimicrobium subarcticum]|uniref:Uncharacterized protein n=1 Tax=Luteimicrobium subarcticum TaxID=620910 RepID=A0A2M8WR08_9MICO|nr:hypothetical protein [Luteimicrobium subarcticum]PJI93372.1 hypothetical protein CLV34_1941 [Luteimicrobium subarcticum]
MVPARASRYVVVAGVRHPARFGFDGTPPVLLAPDGEGTGPARQVGWDAVDEASEVEVWWRTADGDPLRETDREGDRVHVVPRSGAAHWVDVGSLRSRSEIEQLYDVASLRAATPDAPLAGASVPVVRRTVRSTLPDGTPVGRPFVTRPGRAARVPGWLVPVLGVGAVVLVVAGVAVAAWLILAGTAVGVAAVLARYRSIAG